MLTKEQKWMNRLKRCLKDMPEGYEILITSWDFQSSAVSLILKESTRITLEMMKML